ncbi:MAG: UDP-glucose/GDP-mannose dehydrogenase family protein [Phycisphaeraceae bacterium]|nr:MAG: UDP-glucose/GDP-mannose dehydrogenase family protein [Phycisphaeraceae bacterium]
MRLAMVGAGYVGLVTGTCFANTGNDVVCMDVDPSKVETLRNGGCPIYEPGLTEMMRANVKAGRLNFTTNPDEAYRDADMIFICVGTPSDESGRADLKYIFKAAEDVAEVILALGKSQKPKVVVVKSTVPVGTTLKVKEVIRAKVGDVPFHVANNPEFLKEGAAINDFLKPDRVVVGVESEEVGEQMRILYEPYVRQGNPIFIMDILSSEMVKYASNAMLATKISFINEIANLCEVYGSNINRVREGMCSDKRIGNQFLYPGLGYGGSCFPKDVLACIAMGESADRPTRLLSSVHEVNQRQRDAFYSKIEGHFNSVGGLAGRTIAFWGIAFKPNTDDIREAPALTLMRKSLEAGASIRAHDPVAMDNARETIEGRVEFFEDMYRAAEGADALVISTDWDEFKAPNFDRLRELMRSPVIFDGRNLYRREQPQAAGFSYHSVGRPPVIAS